MEKELPAAYVSTGIAALGFIGGIIAGFVYARKPENKEFRYGVFYSLFAGICGAGLFLSSIIFYFLYLDRGLALVTTLLVLLIAGFFIRLAQMASRRGFWSFLTLSILPALAIWPIPITIWNIYYAIKRRK